MRHARHPDPTSYDSFLAFYPAGGFTDIWIDPSSRSIYSTIPYCVQIHSRVNDHVQIEHVSTFVNVNIEIIQLSIFKQPINLAMIEMTNTEIKQGKLHPQNLIIYNLTLYTMKHMKRDILNFITQIFHFTVTKKSMFIQETLLRNIVFFTQDERSKSKYLCH